MEADVARRARDLTLMFDAAGAVGPRHWQSRLARWRAEGWISNLVRQVRSGSLHVPEQSPLHIIALHRDLDGGLLRPRIAAVELLNLLRPTVAISVFITFIAHALHRYPNAAGGSKAGDFGYTELFVQELRRFYPFFPAVAARVRHAFEWKGYRIPPGSPGGIGPGTAQTTTRGAGTRRSSSARSGFGAGTGTPSTSSRKAEATITWATAAQASGSPSNS